MAFVSSFVYCDRIQEMMTPDGPVSQVVSPIQGLRPINLPGNYSFAIACSICDFDGRKKNKVKIKCLDPIGTDVLGCETIDIEPIGEAAQGIGTTLNINLDFRNVVLRMAGVYTSVVYFNDEKIGEYKIGVSKAE